MKIEALKKLLIEKELRDILIEIAEAAKIALTDMCDSCSDRNNEDCIKYNPQTPETCTLYDLFKALAKLEAL